MAAVRTVSVVIATRERAALLARCLDAVRQQEPAPFEILVVDNTSGDDRARRTTIDADARYLVEPLRGVSRARNRAAGETRGDIVAFVDDDAIPEPGWLGALEAEFGDPRVAAVSGRILALSVDGRRDGRPIFGGGDRIVLDRSAADWFGRASFGGIGQGSNLAIRRSVFETWPGFDVRLGAGTRVGGMEEHHAFFSLIDRGHRVVYTPAATVLHPPHDHQESRSRRLRDLKAASFCLALVLAEEPRHRGAAARFALEALRSQPREWRTGPGHPIPAIPRRQKARAQVAGVALYVSSRRRGETGVQ